MKKNALTTPKDKLLNLAAAEHAWAASRWQPGSAAACILSAAVKV